MADKPHIALFMTALAGGGAERVMLTLAEGLGDRGLAIDLVVTRARGSLRGDVPRNVRLVDLGTRRIITSLFPLMRYLHRERPQAMLVALSPTNCIAVWARALARVQLRLILSEHNTPTQQTSASLDWRIRISPTLRRLSYPRADALVAVSCGVADDLSTVIKVPREKIRVIHNPVVTMEMLKKSHMAVGHFWFNRGQPPVVLGVGRLTRQKDFSTLIRAFAELRVHREARLIILGEGEERSRLEALVSELGIGEHVSMPGFVSNPYPYMRQAALFVLSSRWEGLANVLIEAMATGTPVVSTDCPSGPGEILESGKWGRLVPVGDVAALTKAIGEQLDGPKTDPSARAMQFLDARAVEKYYNLLLGELNV